MKKLIIYGAGKKGHHYYAFLKWKGLVDWIYCFVDRNADEIKDVEGIPVLSFEATLNAGVPYVISVNTAGGISHDEIEKILNAHKKEYYYDLTFLTKYTGETITDWNHDYCVFDHIESEYYDFADTKENRDIFWKADSPFYEMFRKLNLDNVIELACGHGRHVPMYAESAANIVLVDVLQENIEYCKNRFKEKDNIIYIKNNGRDVSGLSDNAYTSLFTYDAMVHFELMDIAVYLKDIYRVLKSGSFGLFHHSNNASNYKMAWGNAVHGRSFMNAQIFAYLAYRNGFEIIEQKVIDWGSSKELDCISLIKKS